MGYPRRRPITGLITGTGDTFIVIESFERPTTVQVTPNGGTVLIYASNENILYDAAALGAVNIGGSAGNPNPDGRYVDPGSANWGTALTQTDNRATLDVPAFAIRIEVTVAGTPNVEYHITQA